MTNHLVTTDLNLNRSGEVNGKQEELLVNIIVKRPFDQPTHDTVFKLTSNGVVLRSFIRSEIAANDIAEC